MKVLSIQEPFATLIMQGKKHIETRSWKTSYRGELYIHASKTIFKDLKVDTTNLELNSGYIICKCNLVDCVLMTKEFIKEIKKNKQEYDLGIYEEGRYAFILENIEKIDKIEAKGKLNIFEM